jgi:serine/threonine protein kinase
MALDRLADRANPPPDITGLDQPKMRLCINGTYDFELPMQFDKYDVIDVIGSGGFSVVLRVIDRFSDALYACKVTPRKLLVDQGTFHCFEREVRTLESLSHPCLVHLHDVVYHREFIYLIMECCEAGELFQVLCDQGPLNESTARRLFRDLIAGMEYLHARNIAHRDLKPENCLLTDEMQLKIADFGLCHPTPPGSLLHSPCRSLFYAPPEVVSGLAYDGKVADVWSMGVILYAMVCGSLPWSSTNPVAVIDSIRQADFTIPTYLSAAVRRLIARMLSADPGARPTVAELAADPWISNGIAREELKPAKTTEKLLRRRGTLKRKAFLVRPTLTPKFVRCARLSGAASTGFPFRSIPEVIPKSIGEHR